MSGHGHVTPNPDGSLACCGGPAICGVCARELADKQATGIPSPASPGPSKHRADLLTTTEIYHLDQACQLVSKAFGGEHPYLVGTAGYGNAGSYRDVDVRLMLDGEEFAEACPTRERWELLCLSIGAYLSSRTGLPIDFQIQRVTEGNARHGHRPRIPLGMGGEAARVFAGGGDATPDWGRKT